MKDVARVTFVKGGAIRNELIRQEKTGPATASGPGQPGKGDLGMKDHRTSYTYMALDVMSTEIRLLTAREISKKVREKFNREDKHQGNVSWALTKLCRSEAGGVIDKGPSDRGYVYRIMPEVSRLFTVDDIYRLYLDNDPMRLGIIKSKFTGTHPEVANRIDENRRANIPPRRKKKAVKKPSGAQRFVSSKQQRVVRKHTETVIAEAKRFLSAKLLTELDMEFDIDVRINVTMRVPATLTFGK